MTFDNLSTQRVLRWRSYVEEYSPKINYIEGLKNIILANNLSRLHRLPTLAQLEKSTNLVEPSLEEEIDEIDGYALDQCYTGTYDEDIKQAVDCHLNLPEADALEKTLYVTNTFVNNNKGMLNYL